MSYGEDKYNSSCSDAPAGRYATIKACTSCANIWADEALAKHQADGAKSEEASHFDPLSSADTTREESAIIAGRKRGVAVVQVFEERWDNAGGSYSQ